MRRVYTLLVWMMLLPITPFHVAAADGDVSDLILYEVFVRNFSTNGTLKDVEARLDELHELGVNAIWLMPIHPIGEVKRKGTVGSPYAVRDYRAIDPALGTQEDLCALVAAAHVRGMKVLMDLVPNHSAWDHPFVTTHPDWYKTDEQGALRSPIPDWSDVVQFDYENEHLFAEMKSIMHYWPAACGIDGYRVDVAGMVPDRFWQEIIPELKEAHPGFIMLAEATGGRFHRVGFDLSYDQPLQQKLQRAAQGQGRAIDIPNHVTHVEKEYLYVSARLRIILIGLRIVMFSRVDGGIQANACIGRISLKLRDFVYRGCMDQNSRP